MDRALPLGYLGNSTMIEGDDGLFVDLIVSATFAMLAGQATTKDRVVGRLVGMLDLEVGGFYMHMR